jgi:hypothetical protein
MMPDAPFLIHGSQFLLPNAFLFLSIWVEVRILNFWLGTDWRKLSFALSLVNDVHSLLWAHHGTVVFQSCSRILSACNPAKLLAVFPSRACAATNLFSSPLPVLDTKNAFLMLYSRFAAV